MAFDGLTPAELAKYMKIPMGKPPPGVKPNYIDPDRPLRGGLVASTVLGAVLTTSLVFIRIYTRHFIIKKLSWDDCMNSFESYPR